MARVLVWLLILTKHSDERQISSQEMRSPFELAVPAVTTKWNLFAKLHTEQIQLVYKDNTGSSEEKSLRFQEEANAALDEC